MNAEIIAKMESILEDMKRNLTPDPPPPAAPPQSRGEQVAAKMIRVNREERAVRLSDCSGLLLAHLVSHNGVSPDHLAEVMARFTAAAIDAERVAAAKEEREKIAACLDEMAEKARCEGATYTAVAHENAAARIRRGEHAATPDNKGER
jgi:hypothetical protein